MLHLILYPVEIFICSHWFPTSREQDEEKGNNIKDREPVGVYWIIKDENTKNPLSRYRKWKIKDQLEML
jgi:hypothetical protein